MKKLLIILCVLFTGGLAISQPPNLDSVKAALYKVNKVFDSTAYLGFDVTIRYNSDTLYGKYEKEELTGSYIVNNRNLYYKMGNTEYAQNDSFVFTVYHDDKTMIMTRELLPSNSSLFPLKEFVDSIINWYDTAYTISIRDEDESKVIEFTATQPGLPYQRFSIFYEAVSHYPDKIEMVLVESLGDLGDVPDTIAYDVKQKPVKKLISMQFSNYYHPLTLEIFDTGSYVYFDKIRKRYVPVGKWKNYRFISSGMGEEQPGEQDELYPPPGQ